MYFLFFHCSHFEEIFDEDFFIHALRHHVNVVRELPEDILQRFDNNISNIVNLRVKAWSSPTYYLQKVLPKLMELKYVILHFFFPLCVFLCSIVLHYDKLISIPKGMTMYEF